MEYFQLYFQSSICLKWFTDRKSELRGRLVHTRTTKRILLSHYGALSWTNASWLTWLSPRLTTEAKGILCNDVTNPDKDVLLPPREWEVKWPWFAIKEWIMKLWPKLKMFTGRLQFCQRVGHSSYFAQLCIQIVTWKMYHVC